MLKKFYCIAEIDQDKIKPDGTITILRYFVNRNLSIDEVNEAFIRYQRSDTTSTKIFIFVESHGRENEIKLSVEQFTKIEPHSSFEKKYLEILKFARSRQGATLKRSRQERA